MRRDAGRPTVIVPPRPDRRPLSSVSGLTKSQVKKLEAAGIADAAALAAADPGDLAATLGLKDRAKAEALIDEATRVLRRP